jgi:hypothetical protein
MVQNEDSKEQGAREVNGENNTLHDADNSAGVDCICKVYSENDNGSENCTGGDNVMSSGEIRTSGAITDEDMIEVRKEERKKVMETVTGILN